ncbi:MAG: T9SS type A sorting domain-containing protein [Marinoscillum sp.]
MNQKLPLAMLTSTIALFAHMSFAQTVNIPDENFKNALLAIPSINTNNDSEIQISEAESTTSINVNNKGISDLTGIEAFTALLHLRVGSNNLTSLYLSHNTLLQTLNCYSNNLTGLDISANTSLTNLYCYDNQITALDISQNTALEELRCHKNSISFLDISSNIHLESLWCFSNDITNLELGAAPNLMELRCNNNEITTLISTNLLTALYAQNNNISSLDISASPNLSTLRTDHNTIDKLDLNHNPNLTTLNIGYNKLLTLDLSSNTLLEAFNGRDNRFATLDVSAQSDLTSLDVADNELILLNAQNGNNSNMTLFDATGNPGLTCIQVDNPSYSEAEWDKVGSEASFSANCESVDTDIIYFADANFKEAVLDNGGVDQNSDGQIQIVEAESYNGSLDVKFSNIKNLSGIEYFTSIPLLSVYQNDLDNIDLSHNIALRQLDCGGNNLTSLDLSQNINMVQVSCFSNQLTTLSFTENPDLNEINCNNNQLTSIDLSGNPNLTQVSLSSNLLTDLDLSNNSNITYLEFSRNHITSVDLSGLPVLNRLACVTNNLTALDISSNPELDILECANNPDLSQLNLKNGRMNGYGTIINADDNPSLSCVEIFLPYYGSTFHDFDEGVTFSENCNYPGDGEVVTFEDPNFKEALLADANINTNGDDEIQVYEAEQALVNGVGFSNINSLTGIESFTGLQVIHAAGNNLTSVDVSANIHLIHLDIPTNSISELTFPDGLEELNISENPLDSIDLRGTQVHTITIDSSAISFLNLQSEGVPIRSFSALEVPNLMCIEVDEPSYFETNFRNSVDEDIAFTTDCSSVGTPGLVFIPDGNFKASLVGNSSINTNGDSEIQYTEAEAYTGNLNVNGQNINLMTGIEAFVNITGLYCSFNNISTLDISNLNELKTLEAYSNNLTSLDVSNNVKLTKLRVLNNQLSSLDVSNNPALTYLDCSHNEVTSIDVSVNTSLKTLLCMNNEIGAIDVTNNPELKTLYTYNNLLSSLDISQNMKLVKLWTNDNQLSNLSTGVNPELQDLQIHDNELTSLDLSGASNLQLLNLHDNDINALDLSNNPEITHLQLDFNPIDELNLKNGHNELLQQFSFENTYLSCVEVDDTAYFEANWPSEQLLYTTDCDPYEEVVYIPDVNFKNILLYANGSNPNTNHDDQIQVSEALVFRDPLRLANSTIFDITGIEAFTSLEVLQLNHNLISEVDLTNNVELRVLRAINIGLDSIDLSGNPHLQVLQLAENNLSTIDLSANTELNELEINHNQLTSLDLSNNPDLMEVKCSNNKLDSLVFGSNLFLTKISCSNNNLTTLDLSGLSALERLVANNNLLASIDLANTSMEYLSVQNNKLSNLDVASTPSLTQIVLRKNELTSLDFSNNPIITSIVATQNKLTSLDLRNSNNSGINYLATWENDDLSCIDVDDVASAESKWSRFVDPGVVFSTDCSGSSARIASKDDTPAEPIVLQVFPNPTAGSLCIQSSNPINRVQVYSISGILHDIGMNGNTMDLKDLSAGTYFIKIYQADNVTTHRIIKQ